MVESNGLKLYSHMYTFLLCRWKKLLLSTEQEGKGWQWIDNRISVIFRIGVKKFKKKPSPFLSVLVSFVTVK